MYKSVFTLFAGLAAIASAYTTPVSPLSISPASMAHAHVFPKQTTGPSGNPIYKPGLLELVPAGQPYTITWDPTTAGTVTLVLLRGPSENILPLYPIAEGIANTGTF